MKKYLIKGLLALFAGTFLASCTDHDVEYVPLAQQKLQAYDAAFKELIGGDVDPNQDWGFTGMTFSEFNDDEPVRSNTRAITRTPASGGWEISGGYDMTFKYSKMDEILKALPEGVNASNKLNDYEFVSNGPVEFSIVYSVTSASDRVGYYYYNPSAGINSKTEVLFITTDNNTIPLQNTDIYNGNYYFRYADTNAGKIASPITNPNDPNAWTCPRIWSNYTIDKVYAKKITINVPVGWRMGFFVIDAWDHKMYSNKSLTNENNHYYSAIATLTDGTYAVGLEDWWQGDFDCNDIVMAVIPTGTKPTIISPNVSSVSTQHIKQKRLINQGRVFCEDLGTAGLRDLDFNDIVFDARIWGYREYDVATYSDGRIAYFLNGDPIPQLPDWSYTADICMLAAGGTIPAKMHNSQIHNLFEGKPSQTTMINTVDEHADVKATWTDYYANPGASTYYDVDITGIITGLLAADSKHTITVNDIPISVLWASSTDPKKLDWEKGTMQTVGELHAAQGEVPHKIKLPIGTKWPSERRNIKGAYPYFVEWSKNKNSHPTFYTDSINIDSIYGGNGCSASLPLTDPYGKPYALNDNDLNKDYFTYGEKTTKTTTVYETVVWEGTMELGEWGDSNHSIDLYNGQSRFAGMDDNEKGYIIRIYGTTDGNPGEGELNGAWGARLWPGMWGNNFEDLGAYSDYSKFQDGGYIEYKPISAELIRRLKQDTEWGNSAIVQGKNFTVTKISYVKIVSTTTTETFGQQ